MVFKTFGALIRANIQKNIEKNRVWAKDKFGNPGPEISYGSARWHNYKEGRDSGVLLHEFTPWAIWLNNQAAHDCPKDKPSHVYLHDPGHLLTIAPTRTGKGRCFIIPNLLLYGGPVIVLDIKGENYALTHKVRAERGNIYKFAPFDDDSITWNPFDELAQGDDLWEDAATMAQSLLVPTGASGSVFWEQEAQNILAGIIMHVALNSPPERRNMAEVRRLLAQETAHLFATLDEMAESGNPLIERAANTFLQKSEGVQGSVLATLNSQLSVWDSPRLSKCMSGKSDFTFARLKEDQLAPDNFRALSIYFVIPPDRLSNYRAVVRLFFSLAIKGLGQKIGNPIDKTIETAKGDVIKKLDTLIILDEFAQLGRMDIIREAMSYIAGYGVRLWPFVQDLSQLKAVYGEHWSTFPANAEAIITFGVQDIDTAKWVSEHLGVVTNTEKRWRNDQVITETNARPLLTPDEVRTDLTDMNIVFLRGKHPILGFKYGWDEIPFLKELWESCESD